MKTIKELERKNCLCNYCQGKRRALKDALGLIDEEEDLYENKMSEAKE